MKITLLGSTGSIGCQALDVIEHFAEKVQVVALAAHSRVEELAGQARKFNVKYLVVGDTEAYERLLLQDLPAEVQVSTGAQALEELAALDEVDVVLNALAGAQGLRASYTALATGKRLALANKEPLVIAGDLLMPLARASSNPTALLPIDSEHSAIFQCLVGESRKQVAHLWLTASGGPFRGRTRAELETVRKDDALAHPTWLMGPKITIDSATLMNKGLEVIEAHHLFDLPYDQIKVVVHPQSTIHSMVAFCDGSIKAQLGNPDMRIPIQYALSYPERWTGQAEARAFDFAECSDFSFEKPDLSSFRCLDLAFHAGRAQGTAPCVLNAANEIAVHAFLEGVCGFLDIERTVDAVLTRHELVAIESLEQLEEIDAWARAAAREFLSGVTR